MGGDTVLVVEPRATTYEFWPVETAEHREHKAFLALWSELCAGRSMPSKAEVTPKILRHYLRNIHIYDVIDGGADFYTRVMGSSLYAGLEEDQTGKLVSLHPKEILRTRFSFFMRHIVKNRTPIRTLTKMITGDILTNRIVESLWFPIGEAQVDQILGVVVMKRLDPSAAKASRP